jgi:myosin heavy subunit
MGSIEEIGSIELELDDLSQLPTLTEKSILAATTARFKQNKIYVSYIMNHTNIFK